MSKQTTSGVGGGVGGGGGGGGHEVGDDGSIVILDHVRRAGHSLVRGLFSTEIKEAIECGLDPVKVNLLIDYIDQCGGTGRKRFGAASSRKAVNVKLSVKLDIVMVQ